MTCPNADILSRFVDLTLADGEATDVAEHLAVCDACTRKVEELEHRPEQTMLAALRDMKDAPSDAADPPLPKVIGQYEILERIGSGGMGVVYRAVHPHLKREVALKVIRDTRLDDPTARERFVQEMQSLGKLMHPNIVHATDASIDGDTPFIVTELLDGQDLGSYIAEHGKMPVKQAVDCIRQAATGLAYAHKAGYVHRDIKPSNLFLLRGGIVKILDLGIASPMGVDAGQTSTGHIVGSPEFMAPEQFRGGRGDARSDIYSLGQTFANILHESIPSKLKPILARMTAGLPEQRYQTADEFIRALAAVTRGPSLVFCSSLCAAALIAVLAVVWYMRIPSTNTLVVEPSHAPSPTVIETKNEPAVATPTSAKEESTQSKKGFSLPRFDITNPAGWEDFLEVVLNYYRTSWASRMDDPFEDNLTLFSLYRLLHRMGRESDVQQLASLKLSPPLSNNVFAEEPDQIKELNDLANWEDALGNKEKSDEYHARIRELIAAETLDTKRERLSLRYEGLKKKKRIPKEFTVPKELVNAIHQGETSIKDLCDRGFYREVADQYLELRQKTDDKRSKASFLFDDDGDDASLLGPGASLLYNGYGVTYIIARMVEHGKLDEARKLMQELPHSASMGFRMANSLALGYLKADRKGEAQAVWDESIEKLSKTMNYKYGLPTRTMLAYALLESVNDTGLYEYVRTESGK